MIVGLTYDLREEYLKEGYSEDETAEFDRPDTIAAIENSLRELGYRPECIGHARQLAQQLLSGKRWDIVFNIAEGLYGLGRESLVPALLDAYRIPYVFSDPVVLGISLHKAFAKQIWRDSGLPTPEFCLVRRVDDVREINLPFPLFAKPVAEGTGKGVSAESRIENREQLLRVCGRLLEKYRQPVLVERFLPGREFTVGVLGTGEQSEAIGTLEIILKERAEKAVYSYTNKEYCEELVEYRLLSDPVLDSEAKDLARRAWQALDCRDGGRVDLRADEKGRLQLLEVNPLAGLHPQHSDLPMIATAVGLKYRELIDRIMRSALSRYGLQPPG